jgi:hypothetical protein
MRNRSRIKRPRPPNQLPNPTAAVITGEAEVLKTDDGKNPAAVALGRSGGLKGGKARAAKLTKKQRSESAQKAAKARWNASTDLEVGERAEKRLQRKRRTKISTPSN